MSLCTHASPTLAPLMLESEHNNERNNDGYAYNNSNNGKSS